LVRQKITGNLVAPKRIRKKRFLHESTQRRLCRAAVFLFGVLPLFLTLAFLIVSKTSWYQFERAAAWRERIRNNLGLDVVFASIKPLSPNRFEIQELVCFHPETRSPILRSARVEGLMTTKGWAITLHGAELEQNQADLAVRIIHDSFLCRPHNAVRLLKLSVPELVLQNTSSLSISSEPRYLPNRLYRVEAEYSPSMQTSDLKLRFALTPTSEIEPIAVHIRRQHSDQIPVTDWAVHTGKSPFPCSILYPFLPNLESLGELASFTGKADYSSTGSQWSLSGVFENLDWERFGKAIGSPLLGKGTLLVSNAKIKNQRLESFEGEIRGGSQVNFNWLRYAPIQLHAPHKFAVDDRSHLPVNDLKLLVRIDSLGVHCRGGLSEEQDGFRLTGLIDQREVYAATQTIRFDRLFDWMASHRVNYESTELAIAMKERLQSSLAGYLPMPHQPLLSGPSSRVAAPLSDQSMQR
jgi:hypothetical protein